MGSSNPNQSILKILEKEREKFLKACAEILIGSSLKKGKTVSRKARFKMVNQRLQEIYLLYKATRH